MSGYNPKGEELIWINGESYQGLEIISTYVGAELFWINGKSDEFLIPQRNFGNFLMMF
jgi:hypothetical protein